MAISLYPADWPFAIFKVLTGERQKKTHTDKNLLLINEMTGKVVYLGPTEPGKKHDKKAADEAQMGYPRHATLDKDPGFQG
jgi:hypothetical protein